MAWDRRAPFDYRTGALQEYETVQRGEGHYDEERRWHQGEILGPAWRDAEPFEAEMTLVGYGRGRSAVTFYWHDEKGLQWPMFLTDAFDMVSKEPVVRSGLWIVTKRGANYAVKPVDSGG